MKMYSRQSGVSLVELMIVVSLGALALVAVMMLYPRVMNNINSNRMTSDVMSLAAGVREFTGHRPQYEFLSTPATATLALVQAEKVPRNLIAGTSAAPVLVSNFGADITLDAEAPFNEFTIAYDEVPTGVCQSVVMSLVQNFKKASVGTSEFTLRAVDPSDVATACVPTGANDGVTITFTAA